LYLLWSDMGGSSSGDAWTRHWSICVDGCH
jgi:hypothetical protein